MADRHQGLALPRPGRVRRRHARCSSAARATSPAVDALKDAGESGCPFLLVVGASGSGKSSLVMAGLVPRLTRRAWCPRSISGGRRGHAPRRSMRGSDRRACRAPLRHRQRRRGAKVSLRACPRWLRATTARRRLAGAPRTPTTRARPIVGRSTGSARKSATKSGHDRPVRADLLLIVDQLDELFGPAEVCDDERLASPAARVARGDGPRMGDRDAARRSLRALPQAARAAGDEDARARPTISRLPAPPRSTRSFAGPRPRPVSSTRPTPRPASGSTIA